MTDDGVNVLALVCVSVGQVAAAQLPARPKLPRYPVPALRLGRLAVDSRYQDRGIGQDLLAFALRLARALARQAGLYAVVVEAKHDQAGALYQRFGFLPTLDNPLCLFLPVATLEQADAE